MSATLLSAFYDIDFLCKVSRRLQALRRPAGWLRRGPGLSSYARPGGPFGAAVSVHRNELRSLLSPATNAGDSSTLTSGAAFFFLVEESFLEFPARCLGGVWLSDEGKRLSIPY